MPFTEIHFQILSKAFSDQHSQNHKARLSSQAVMQRTEIQREVICLQVRQSFVRVLAPDSLLCALSTAELHQPDVVKNKKTHGMG